MRSLTEQDYQGPKSLIVSVSPQTSIDPGVADELRSIPGFSVTFIANEADTVAAALNESVAQSDAPVLIRLGSGTILPPDYTSIAVRILTTSGASLVGGRVRYRGHSDFEKAVARAFTLKVGKGGDPFLVEGPDGDNDGDSQAVFLRNALIEAGLYDEDLRAGHDWELNYRLRSEGHTVWRTSSLVRVDRPPRRLPTLTRSLFADGLWRGQVRRQFPKIPGLVYRLPLAVVIAVTAAFIAGAAGLFGLVAGAVSVAAFISTVLSYFLLVPVAYILAVITLGVVVAVREGWRVGLWFAVVLPAIHFSWGSGFLFGYLRVDPPVREPDEL